MQVKSLRGILYLSFAVLIFITLFIVGLPMLNMIRGYVGQMSRRQTEQVLYHLEQSLDKTMGRIHRLSDQLTELERLQEFIIARGTPEAESFLNERFAELAQIYDDVVSLFAFEHSSTHRGSGQPVRFVSSRSGFEFNEEKPLREEPWYSSALEAGGTVVITPPHLQNFIKRNYMWVVSLSRRLYAPPDASSPDTPSDTPSDSSLNADSPAPAGILLIDITIDVIKDICLKNSSDTHYYYIADPSGTIIFHPKSQLIHSGVFKEPVQQVLQSTGTAAPPGAPPEPPQAPSASASTAANVSTPSAANPSPAGASSPQPTCAASTPPSFPHSAPWPPGQPWELSSFLSSAALSPPASSNPSGTSVNPSKKWRKGASTSRFPSPITTKSVPSPGISTLWLKR